MRVLVVTVSFPSESTPGAGIFNLRDAEFLSRRHDVTVLHLMSPASPDAADLSERTLSPTLRVRRALYDVRTPELRESAAQRIRDEAEQHDLVHTMVVTSLLPVDLARTGLPWVHTEHASVLVNAAAPDRVRLLSRIVPTRVRVRLQGNWLRGELTRPDVVIAVGRDLARSVGGYRRDRVRVIGNSVRFPQDELLPEPPESRGDGPLRLVAVGNLLPWKGPLELVDAVSLLNRRGVDATLQWAGVGRLEAEVRERAAELGVEDRVDLLGHVDPDELLAILRGAHLFVLPTRSETFGIAIAEAIACGLPVVTSGSGEHTEFLPREASRVLASRDGESLADAILDLASSPDRWPAERIQRYAREAFSDEQREAAYAEAYSAALSKRGRTAPAG